MQEDRIDLILRAKKGDRFALEELIREEQSSIYAMLFYLKKDEYDLSDIMQNVLIKLSKKIHQLRDPKNFKIWLNQIILNSYYDYIRERNRKNRFRFAKLEDDLGFEISDNKQNPQNSVLYNELDLIIKNSIENLPLHYKIPITLREIQGLSYDEISNLTNTSIGTVKSRIARARAMIKDDVNKYSKG